ncbi:MAG: hypothetical protein JWP89_1469 [Schlesneria sp.]|nr:hypothetical protein [Schlesneria sp.]
MLYGTSSDCSPAQMAAIPTHWQQYLLTKDGKLTILRVSLVRHAENAVDIGRDHVSMSAD